MKATKPKKPCPPGITGKIKNQTLWSTLDNDEVELFNRRVGCRRYLAGETVFVQGDECKGLYFIDDGLVAVRKTDMDGQSVLVRLAKTGDTLGYRPLLAKQDHHATAEILKEANICFLDAVTARTFIYNNHELGLRFLEQTARALGETEERLYEVAVLDVHVRLIHLLLLFRDNWGQTLEDGSVSIVLPVTREEIASMVGARPESIYRAIRRLESDGLALFKGRQVHIEHFELLAEELQINLQTVQ